MKHVVIQTTPNSYTTADTSILFRNKVFCYVQVESIFFHYKYLAYEKGCLNKYF